MKLLNVIDEDIINYKKICMYIALPTCSMKCNIDCGKDVCQNSNLQNDCPINTDGDELVKRYLANPLTKQELHIMRVILRQISGTLMTAFMCTRFTFVTF